MPTTLAWQDIAIRLAFTVGAGTLIGLNRSEHNRPAGLRTTLLVCLAASLAMLQANVLMNTVGKASNSFVVLDLMRLPLGILTGVGFIGAGTILRRGNAITGVTTAATIWFVTVMGLCFGGGQIGLGLAALVLGLLVLWGLKWIENHSRQHCAAKMSVTLAADDASDDEILNAFITEGFQISVSSIITDVPSATREIKYSVKWWAKQTATEPPALIKTISARPGIIRFNWKRLRLNN